MRRVAVQLDTRDVCGACLPGQHATWGLCSGNRSRGPSVSPQGAGIDWLAGCHCTLPAQPQHSTHVVSAVTAIATSI